MGRQNLEGITLNKMLEYFGRDTRRINHALKVLSFTKAIASGEDISELKSEILTVAAILHDIGIKVSEEKYNSSAGTYQEAEGPAVAKELLKDLNLEESFVERVCFLIGHHHTYSAIDGIDFQILVEADFLVNIFEDGMGEAQINSIINKIFKTKTGISIIKSLYQ